MTQALSPVESPEEIAQWETGGASTVELLNVVRERTLRNVQTYSSQPDVMREFLLAQERIEDAIDRFNHGITMAQTGYVIQDAERTFLGRSPGDASPDGSSRTQGRAKQGL